MVFTETKLKGAFIIEPDRIGDDRGFFARTWCQREFKDHGLSSLLVQCNISFNNKKGTLRGMHYQVSPYGEAKVVRCTAGEIFDVIIDLRPDSETFTKWLSFVLTEENRNMIYVPEGFAHGFITLIDNTEVFYQMSEFHSPEHARGIRWDDQAIGIIWPIEAAIISVRDRNYPLFSPEK